MNKFTKFEQFYNQKRNFVHLGPIILRYLMLKIKCFTAIKLPDWIWLLFIYLVEIYIVEFYTEWNLGTDIFYIFHITRIITLTGGKKFQ